LFEVFQAIIVTLFGVLDFVGIVGNWVEMSFLRVLDVFETLVTWVFGLLMALGMIALLIFAPLLGCVLLFGLVRFFHSMECCFHSMDMQPEIDNADRLVDSLPQIGCDIVGSAACPICLHNFDDTRQISRTLCGGLDARQDPHAFHTDCLRIWLSKRQSCPLCRQDVAAQATASF